MRRVGVFLGLLCLLAGRAGRAEAGAATSRPDPGAESKGAWKTVFASRLIRAAMPAEYVSGPGGTLRMAIPMPLAGTKVRVFVAAARRRPPPKLKKMALVKGADEKGRITGPLYPVLFGGKASLTLAAKSSPTCVSDVIPVPVTRGIWYLQESWASESIPATRSNYWGFHAPGDQFDRPVLGKRTRFRLGATCRIDVYTTDRRPVIACYGDSITRGMSSTIGSGNHYPALLGELIDRPVLNLGVDGDLIAANVDRCPRYVAGLAGVEQVVFLMGINDVLKGTLTRRGQYVAAAARIIRGLRQRKLKVYMGTLPPAGGPHPYVVPAQMDKLRRDINDWIRTKSGADGVIDFDAALRDPGDPARMLARYQCGDWLHPSEAGYRKMAETAAAELRRGPKAGGRSSPR